MGEQSDGGSRGHVSHALEQTPHTLHSRETHTHTSTEREGERESLSPTKRIISPALCNTPVTLCCILISVFASIRRGATREEKKRAYVLLSAITLFDSANMSWAGGWIFAEGCKNLEKKKV